MNDQPMDDAADPLLAQAEQLANGNLRISVKYQPALPGADPAQPRQAAMVRFPSSLEKRLRSETVPVAKLLCSLIARQEKMKDLLAHIRNGTWPEDLVKAHTLPTRVTDLVPNALPILRTAALRKQITVLGEKITEVFAAHTTRVATLLKDLASLNAVVTRLQKQYAVPAEFVETFDAIRTTTLWHDIVGDIVEHTGKMEAKRNEDAEKKRAKQEKLVQAQAEKVARDNRIVTTAEFDKLVQQIQQLQQPKKSQPSVKSKKPKAADGDKKPKKKKKEPEGRDHEQQEKRKRNKRGNTGSGRQKVVSDAN
jgi:hypothetical protein